MMMPLPLLAAVLGSVFCIWTASGNALNLCVTTGCSLYQDTTVAGISMWWLGAGAFALLAVIAALGRPWLGLLAAGGCLLADTGLLLLMLLTAPCVGCLLAALFFALCFAAFRHANKQRGQDVRRSWLLLVWGVFFAINIGAVLRTEFSMWAMHGPEDATVRVYFSPSCSACREAVTNLSGRVNVAFYPLAENTGDTARVAAMLDALSQGANMAEALMRSKDAPAGTLWQQYRPDTLLLRFRLLRNKAHVLAAGSSTVPFIEYHGLPAGLIARKPAPRQAQQGGAPSPAAQDATLPIDTGIAGSCGGGTATPCP